MASLRALECLVAVADSGSITQAARLLHSSQPAVSHQLAMLERETRTILLRRDSRGVTLTPAGRAAIADALRAATAAAAAVRSARATGEAAGGVLRLACAQSPHRRRRGRRGGGTRSRARPLHHHRCL